MKKSVLRASGLSLFLALTLSFSTHAQAPAWESDLGASIQWQRTTQFGTLVASTPQGIKGIDPESGKVLWTTDAKYGSLPEDRVEIIQNSPFITVTAGNKDDEDMAIIETFEGKVVFSSRAAGLQKVVSRYFLYQSGTILVLGTGVGSKTPSVHMIDMATGQKIWSKESEFGIVLACHDLGNDEFIALTAFFVYKMNARTGEVIYKKSVDPRYEKMSGLMSMFDKGAGNFFDNKEITAAIVVTDKNPDAMYISVQGEQKSTKKDSNGKETVEITYSRNYMGYDLKSGNNIWPAVVNLQGKMGIVMPDVNGLIVSQGDGNDMNCLDYKTGAGKWGKKGKGISLKGGPLQGSAYVGKDLVTASGKKNNFIDVIDPATGLSKMGKPTKVSGMVSYMEILPCGLLYGTEEEVDIINLTTGDKMLAKSLKANQNLITDNGGKVYVFNLKDKLVYEIDPSNGNAKPLGSTGLSFEGKESATRAEGRSEGVVVTSDQNVAMIGYDGSIKFQKYYAAPRETGLKRALLYANAVYGAYATMAYGLTSAAYGSVSQSIQVKNSSDQAVKDVTGVVSQAYGDASRSAAGFTGRMMAAANKRFKATQQANDYMFILTEVAKKQYALLRISKLTGETLSTIDLAKDKNPVYEIDGIENRVFYMYKDKIVRGYQF